MTIDSPTRDLLDLIADDPQPWVTYEWNVFVAALREAADESGRIWPNAFREKVRGHMEAKRIGPFTCRAIREGLIESTGEVQKSTDHKGRNGNKWSVVYRLVAS